MLTATVPAAAPRGAPRLLVIMIVVAALRLPSIAPLPRRSGGHDAAAHHGVEGSVAVTRSGRFRARSTRAREEQGDNRAEKG